MSTPGTVDGVEVRGDVVSSTPDSFEQIANVR